MYTSASDKNFFVGRDSELEELTKSIVFRKDRLAVISGLAGTGKTSLWRFFLQENKDLFDEKVEIIYTSQYYSSFPELSNQIKLVIFEDIGRGFNLSLKDRIVKYIDRYSDRQFIIVGNSKNYLPRFNPQTHIHLDVLGRDEISNLVIKLIAKNIDQNEITKIVSVTSGSPFLVRLIADYVNSGNYTVDHVLKLISENIRYNGITNKVNLKGNNLIIDNVPELIHVTNDIKLVNQDILEKIRRNPYDMHHLNPRQFEEMIAELMMKKGYNVDLTKATRDGGKDLIIANHKDIGNFIYYVECKKYAPTNPVGVNLVRELAGTIAADRVTAGLMITSSYFSPDAVQFSEIFKNQMSLIDFMKLKEWLAQL